MADYIYLVQMDIPRKWKTSSIGCTTPSTCPTSQRRPACMAATATGWSRRIKTAWRATRRSYEIDSPGVPESEGWLAESEKGDWATKIRPHTTNRSHTIFKRVL